MRVLISCSGKVKIHTQIIFSETVSSPCVLWEQLWSFPVGFQWDVYLNKGWYHLINHVIKLLQGLVFIYTAPKFNGSVLFLNSCQQQCPCATLLHISSLQLSLNEPCRPFPVPWLTVLAYILLRTGQRLSSFVLVLDLLLFLLCTSQQLPHARYSHSIKHVLEKAALSVSHMMTNTFGSSREKPSPLLSQSVPLQPLFPSSHITSQFRQPSLWSLLLPWLISKLAR